MPTCPHGGDRFIVRDQLCPIPQVLLAKPRYKPGRVSRGNRFAIPDRPPYNPVKAPVSGLEREIFAHQLWITRQKLHFRFDDEIRLPGRETDYPANALAGQLALAADQVQCDGLRRLVRFHPGKDLLSRRFAHILDKTDLAGDQSSDVLLCPSDGAIMSSIEAKDRSAAR